MKIQLFIAFLIFILMISGCIRAYLGERKDWNHGICPRCGGRLEHFDTDSQGGLGYICKECREYWCWISWFNPEKSRQNVKSKNKRKSKKSF